MTVSHSCTVVLAPVGPTDPSTVATAPFADDELLNLTRPAAVPVPGVNAISPPGLLPVLAPATRFTLPPPDPAEVLADAPAVIVTEPPTPVPASPDAVCAPAVILIEPPLPMPPPDPAVDPAVIFRGCPLKYDTLPTVNVIPFDGDDVVCAGV